MKKNQNKNQKKTLLNVFINHIYALNNSKFFAGVVMIMLNVGSKYITVELSKSQEEYLKNNVGRQILIFAISWMMFKNNFVII